MPDKKDRDRFSIKFNLNDPLHEKAVRLLEQQGARRKAQFIANAILHYVSCPETPELEVGQSADRSYVEAMVMEILRQQGFRGKIPATMPEADTAQLGVKSKAENEMTTELTDNNAEPEGLTLSKEVDEMTKALIADTIMSFRNN